MKNQELAKIFSETAIFLEMEEASFRSISYERAALNLETLEKDVEEVYKNEGIKGLEEIPGIGVNLARKIEEYLRTGKIKLYEELKKKTPVDLESLIAVEGIGPKMVRDLWHHLKIRNLKDLEKAAKAKKIRILPHFGEKTEANILQGIEFLKKSQTRFLLGEILPTVQEIILKLGALKEVEKVSLAGSLRRRKETIGDADILAISQKPEKVVDFFISLPDIAKVWGQGKTKASIRMKQGFDIDLRIIPEKSYGAALQYFTGSKEHNIATRKIAIEKGLKLNEYGLFKGKNMIASQNEKDIYKAIGLPFIEPELRENQGEIEAALRQAQGKLPGLPHLIGYKDVLGDLHCHSSWNGGRNTILEMAKAGQNMGYQYLGIADHTKFLRIEKGLDESQLLRQGREIDKLNREFKNRGLKFRLLHGCEANILKDGSIDIRDGVLKALDFVIAGIHSNMKMAKFQMTKRLIKAMENPNVDIISHPTGRILKKRDEYQTDFPILLRTAKKTKTVLEINAFPDRLDLSDLKIRQAKETGVKMVINTDAHSKEHLSLMGFGVSQARRGWLEKQDIVNAWPLDMLLTFLKN